MSDVTRNVTINVGVKTSMSDAADGLKLIQSSAASATAELSKLDATLAKIVDRQGSMQVASLEADRSAVRNKQRSSGGSTALPPDTDLSAMFGADIATSGGSSVGLNDSDISSMMSLLKKGTRGGKRNKSEQDEREDRHQNILDNDIANKVNDTKRGNQKELEDRKGSTDELTKANEAYAASSRNAANSAMEFAKGLAFIALSGNKNNEELARGIVQAQGYFNVIRGGLGTMHSFGEMISAKRAAASSQGAASSAGGAASSGVSVGAISALANPLALIATLIAGAALIQRSLNQWAVEDSKREKETQIQYSAIKSQSADRVVGEHVGQSIRAADAVPDFKQVFQTGTNLRIRGQVESNIRKTQSESDMSFEGKQEIRQRMERQLGLHERSEEARNRLSHIEKQQKELRPGYGNLASDMQKSHEAYTKQRGDIVRSFRRNTGYNRAEAAVYGVESDDDVSIHNQEKKKELGKLDQDRQAELNRQQESGIQLQEKSVALAKQRVEAASSLIATTREQVAAARENFEHDKQSAAVANRSFGSQSIGNQHVLRNLEEKRKRGWKFAKWERDFIRSNAASETKLHEAAGKGDEAEGGNALEMQHDVKASGKKFREAEKNQSDIVPDAQKTVEDQSNKLATAMDQLKKSIEMSGKMESLLTTLTEAFASQAKQIDDAILQIKRFVK